LALIAALAAVMKLGPGFPDMDPNVPLAKIIAVSVALAVIAIAVTAPHCDSVEPKSQQSS
jgi:hypothetical protein